MSIAIERPRTPLCSNGCFPWLIFSEGRFILIFWWQLLSSKHRPCRMPIRRKVRRAHSHAKVVCVSVGCLMRGFVVSRMRRRGNECNVGQVFTRQACPSQPRLVRPSGDCSLSPATRAVVHRGATRASARQGLRVIAWLGPLRCRHHVGTAFPPPRAVSSSRWRRRLAA